MSENKKEDIFDPEGLHGDANTIYDAYSQWADEFKARIEKDNKYSADDVGAEVLTRYLAEYYIDMHGQYDEYRLWADKVTELMHEWQKNIKSVLNDDKKKED